MAKYKTDNALKDMGAYKETNLHDKYHKKWILISCLPFFLCLPFIVPLYILLAVWGDGYGNPVGFSDLFYDVGQYFLSIYHIFTGEISPFVFFKSYFVFWFLPAPADGMEWNTRFPFVVIPSIFLIASVLIYAIKSKDNPYRKTPNIYGDARWATEADITEMGDSNLIGFEDTVYKGKPMSLFTIGNFYDKKLKKDRLIRMGETLSILLLAPPGTGKTAGFIVPSTLSMDHTSLFLHDQKPELFDMTSGWRAKLGPVFQLKWSAQNEPEGIWATREQLLRISPDLVEKDEHGNEIINEDGLIKTKPIFYPSWNPLSLKSMPGPGIRRDLYIERLVNVLCPTPKSGDAFFADKGRVALLGLIHFLAAKVEYATHPLINGGWDGIPKQWIGHEASFPMLIDWYTDLQDSNDEDADSDDPMRAVFKKCIDEARMMDDKFEEIYKTRVLNRAIAELTSLMSAPDKTRSSILQTSDAALNAFKNAAVAQRTAVSDFAFNELRGMPIPEAKKREEDRILEEAKQGRTYKARYKKEEYKPVTIYISIPAEDAKTFSGLTGIFVDSANAYLVANGPNAIDDQGNQNGPFPFGFLLDEAPQLPKLDTVRQGPAVGRSKKVFYVIVGQDFGQFAEIYSKEEVGSLKSITAIKIMLAQNNEESAKQVSSMIGKTTVVKHSYSPKGGGGGKKGIEAIADEIFSKGKMSASESFEAVDFVKSDQVMSLKKGTHIVIVQNFANRPLFLNTPFFFAKNSKVLDKVYNFETGVGLPLTTPMPMADIEKSYAKWLERKEVGDKQLDKRNKLRSSRLVAIMDPVDFVSAAIGEAIDDADIIPPDTYGWAFANLDYKVYPENETASYVDAPTDADIFGFDTAKEAYDFIDGARVVLYDVSSLEHFNAWLEESELPPLDLEMVIFLKEKMAQIGEEEVSDRPQSLYNLAVKSITHLSEPEDSGEDILRICIGSWFAGILTFYAGVEEMRNSFGTD